VVDNDQPPMASNIRADYYRPPVKPPATHVSSHHIHRFDKFRTDGFVPQISNVWRSIGELYGDRAGWSGIGHSTACHQHDRRNSTCQYPLHASKQKRSAFSVQLLARPPQLHMSAGYCDIRASQ
jgi:hypothetical protein